MANVSSLISMLDDKLGPYTGRIVPGNSSDNTDAKIRALDAGKEKVWQALVAASKKGATNWFASSTSITINLGTRSASLPSDCHDVLSVELAGVPFRPSAWHKQNWRDQREDATSYATSAVSEALWIVSGNNPPSLEIGPKFTANISPTVFYTSKLSTWSATGDSADVVPSPYHDAICNYAAWYLYGPLQDPAVGEGFWRAWQADRELILGAAGSRQQGGVVTDEDYDSRG